MDIKIFMSLSTIKDGIRVMYFTKLTINYIQSTGSLRLNNTVIF